MSQLSSLTKGRFCSRQRLLQSSTSDQNEEIGECGATTSKWDIYHTTPAPKARGISVGKLAERLQEPEDWAIRCETVSSGNDTQERSAMWLPHRTTPLTHQHGLGGPKAPPLDEELQAVRGRLLRKRDCFPLGWAPAFPVLRGWPNPKHIQHQQTTLMIDA